MKRYLVVLVIVLVAGAWVAGFAPEYSARHAAEAERDRLRERAVAAEERLRFAELLGQALALGDLVRGGRFVEAQPLSSAFFDAVRAESQRVEEAGFREALLEALESRDAVTAALSRGEEVAAVRIAQIERRLRRALGYTVPGGAPPAAEADPASDPVPPSVPADDVPDDAPDGVSGDVPGDGPAEDGSAPVPDDPGSTPTPTPEPPPRQGPASR